VRAGRAAADALIERHKAIVYRIVQDLHLPPQVERDDLIQHGMMALVRAMEKFSDGKSKFITYAWTCVSNAVRRAAGDESRKTTSLHDRPLDEGGCELLDLLPAQEPSAVAEAVRERLGKLSPLYRKVVSLHFGLEGEPLGMGEIARRVGLTPPQARRALDLALAQM
jgi:RNA polymerase sigma factor (sigma-70 family)